MAMPDDSEPLSRLGPRWESLTPRAREVLDAVEELFVSEGFAALPLTEIAARVKCSRRTLYELAPDRHHLVMYVVDRRYRRMGRLSLQRVAEAGEPQEKLRALLTTEIIAMGSHSPAFLRDAAANPAVRALLADHARGGVRMMAAVLEEGMASGAFKPTEATFVAELIGAMVTRLHEPRMDDGHLDFAARVLVMVSLIESGVCA